MTTTVSYPNCVCCGSDSSSSSSRSVGSSSSTVSRSSSSNSSSSSSASISFNCTCGEKTSWTLTIAGVTDSPSTACSSLNGTFTLNLVGTTAGGCAWEAVIDGLNCGTATVCDTCPSYYIWRLTSSIFSTSPLRYGWKLEIVARTATGGGVTGHAVMCWDNSTLTLSCDGPIVFSNSNFADRGCADALLCLKCCCSGPGQSKLPSTITLTAA